MEFVIEHAKVLLSKTPTILDTWLRDLPQEWLVNNEGQDTWSPYDVVGHLIHGELNDWIVRTKIILDRHEGQFKPFDRLAQFENSQGKTIGDLLDEFGNLRVDNLKTLDKLEITEEELKLVGIHPEFGRVTLKQLLSTWVAHDLGHILQISRTMVKNYRTEIGPWTKYLSVFHT